MIKYSSNNRRFPASAKFFAAAFSVALGWCVASAFPSGSTLGTAWRFRFESFGPFSQNERRCAEDRSLSYLDASGRRVAVNAETSSPRLETAPTFVAESTELLADDALPLEKESVGATFDEAEPELEPVAFDNAQTPASSFADASWLVVDQNAQEREEWSRELRLGSFSEPKFAEFSLPNWRDAVALESATPDELRALEFEPGVSSSLVSPELRRLANARLASGDHEFAETSNASDANAPQTPNASSQTAQKTPTQAAPTRVGAFAACGAFEADGVAKVRVQ
jgi:hypothetical protein